MISPRHHAISLAAVFLALAVGVVLGSGLLSDTLLAGLRDDKRNLHERINGLEKQNNGLNEKLNSTGEFDSTMAARIIHNALADKSVIIFRTPDASDDKVGALSRLVGDASGKVTGTVSLTRQFVDANSSEKLLSVVNSSIPAGSQLNSTFVDQGSQAGDLLGIVLLINRSPATPAVNDTQRDTALAALRQTGFITYADKQVTPANIALVVTGGALTDDAGNVGPTVARFAAAMAPHGSGTVLAGTDGSASGTAAVAVTRSDPALVSAVSTVDDIDAEQGRITTVLALQDLLAAGHAGHYGIGQGAQAVTVAQ